MAVAAHVGRVSSDYPPSGYSISRRFVMGTSDNLGGGWPGGGKWKARLYADDGGFWIDGIEVVFPQGYGGGDPDNANTWHADVISMDPVTQTKYEDMVHIETVGAAIGAGEHFSVVEGGVGGPPFLGHYVQPGSYLGLFVNRLGAPGADLRVVFHVRYRTKA
jgi:hypothetical protein